MSIGPLSSNIVNLLSEMPVANEKTNTGAAGNFSDILTEAFNNIEATDKADKASAIELLTGQSDDLSGLMLDAKKAELALQLGLQMRSKVLDAYNEIMRMQI